MFIPQRTADNEVWYRRPGKRRPARVVYDNPVGTPATVSENRGREAVAVAAEGVAVEGNPTSQSARRRREGHGEG